MLRTQLKSTSNAVSWHLRSLSLWGAELEGLKKGGTWAWPSRGKPWYRLCPCCPLGKIGSEGWRACLRRFAIPQGTLGDSFCSQRYWQSAQLGRVGHRVSGTGSPARDGARKSRCTGNLVATEEELQGQSLEGDDSSPRQAPGCKSSLRCNSLAARTMAPFWAAAQALGDGKQIHLPGRPPELCFKVKVPPEHPPEFHVTMRLLHLGRRDVRRETTGLVRWRWTGARWHRALQESARERAQPEGRRVDWRKGGN